MKISGKYFFEKMNRKPLVTMINKLLVTLAIGLILVNVVNAQQKAAQNIKISSQGQADPKFDPNDPNQILMRWEEPIKKPGDANELMRVKSDAVLKVLRDQNIDQQTKEKIVGVILTPVFDFELMSKLSLGKAQWMKLSPDQQKEFTDVFTRKLKQTYLGQITRYKDEKVLLKPAEHQKNGLSIAMEVLSGDKKISTVYKLRPVNKSWKVYDVEIEGVSIILTYKAQFEDVLKRGTIEDVISNLEKPQVK